jgi:hypothetical protein
MKVGLLCNTYGGDLPWFEKLAKSYSKFATGWEWFKVVVPNESLDDFKLICDPLGIFVSGFDEWPGKGFNHHQAMQCMGDLHFREADAVTHIDADCVFASPTDASEYFIDGRPLAPFIDFERLLTRPIDHDEMMTFMGFTGKKADFTRGQLLWKFAAEFALGFQVPRSTMVWMPITHIVEVYGKLRRTIAAHHGKPFDHYVIEQRNEFPQTFCEFESLGGVAYKFFEPAYHWWNIHDAGHPFAGKVVQSWSHGGFDKPHQYGAEVGGFQTPRDLHARLGL